MRSLIQRNDHVISFLMKLKLSAEHQLPADVETDPSVDDVTMIVQTISVACDPQMIKDLVGSGVVFSFKSVIHSLKRKNIETFRCLLDIVPLEDEDEIHSIIIGALRNDLRIEAAKCLSERNYFAQVIFFGTAMYIVITENVANAMDLVNMFCDAKPYLSQPDFNILVYTCMMFEKMDVLSYLHKSFRKIDLEYCRQLAVEADLPDYVADYLQSLE
ncbi:predicted protein [Chaetoceros tenuissimus]|uniref:Uncharacterized protein n=1 Tax=Chaetoceros tenuissimus TaxID=426638 RepID=A0AAD3HBH8_9STRA|nr:predicted protein [Chaetoceros tenuissimus]